MKIFPTVDDFEISPQFAQRTLLYGIGVGVLGSFLFLDIERPGLAMTLWLSAFALAATSLATRFRPDRIWLIVLWSAIAILAAAVLLVRLNTLALLTMPAMALLAAVVVIMELRGQRLGETRPFQFLGACLRLPLQALTGCMLMLGKVDIRSNINDPKFFPVLRGLVIALPLILIIGSLFSSADARFESLFGCVMQFFGPDMPEHILISFCVGWLATGLLVTISCVRKHEDLENAPGLKIGEIETRIVMLSLLALFLLFVVVQLPYLFGGRETIESTPGLTLATYARRGFFELVSVTAITLVLLIILNSSTSNAKRFQPFAFALLTCLFIIMISAGQRLTLYMDSFGLTLARLAAAAFMTWLALCLIVFGTCLRTGNDSRLVPVAVYSAISLVFALSLANPVRLITNYNIETARQNDTALDVEYLLSLGVEVVPRLLEEYDALEFGQQCLLAGTWTDQFGLDEPETARLSDWRNWNLAYKRALESVEQHRDAFPILIDHAVSRRMLPPMLYSGYLCQHSSALFPLGIR